MAGLIAGSIPMMGTAIDGATTSPNDVTTMATAVEALGAELGTPRKAENKAREVARDLPVNAARRARAAKHRTSVLCVDEA